MFASRLFDPFDAEHSAPGQAAWDKVFQSANGVVGEVRKAIADPGAVLDGLRDGAGRLNVRLDPEASPPASTFGGEMRRQAGVGLNQGEMLFDLGSVLYGGAALKGIAGVGKAGKAVGAEKYLAGGVPPGMADYFATPYTGRGHHSIAQRTKLPPYLGGGAVPSFISDSPFFLLKPPGISTGDMYKRHVRVDPRYGGGKVPAKFGGGGWSGKALGWEKYGPLGQVWYGTPMPMKAIVGSGVIGAGALVDQADGENRQ